VSEVSRLMRTVRRPLSHRPSTTASTFQSTTRPRIVPYHDIINLTWCTICHERGTWNGRDDVQLAPPSNLLVFLHMLQVQNIAITVTFTCNITGVDFHSFLFCCSISNVVTFMEICVFYWVHFSRILCSLCSGCFLTLSFV
jgi:hypothetical protein